MRWINASVVAILTLHALLLVYGASVHSPTYNEPAHLAAGISYWHFCRFGLYSVNPPLVRMIAALPPMLAGCKTDWKSFDEGPGTRAEMAVGNDFCSANGDRTPSLISVARWGCIPFSLLGGYICFLWASELYGVAAGLVSLTMWCFCPNIIAHGQLITSDMAATTLGVAACYTFWHWLKAPTWSNTALSGLIVGLAELSKTTLIILLPVWLLLWLFYRLSARHGMAIGDWTRELSMMCVRILIGMYVVNVGYGFEGSCTPLGRFTFVSRSFTGIADATVSRHGGNRFTESWLGTIRVPLPKHYICGMDLQRKDFESYGHEFYLRGVWAKNGWWYYYLYALAVKVPLGIWLILIVTVVARLTKAPAAKARDEIVLLTPAIVILAFVSAQTGINEHMRYVLPIVPLCFIWMGSTAMLICGSSCERVKCGRLCGYVVTGALTWSVCSSLACYPHSLSYFNEAVGGSKNGWKHLTWSNVDWGQDLLYFKRWSEEHPHARPLRMALFGSVDPHLVGVDADVFTSKMDEGEWTRGYYAVSATMLSGFGQSDHGKALATAVLQARPYARVGGSIVVFAKE